MVGKLFAIPLRLLVVIGLLLYSAVVGATSRILLLHQPPWSTQEVALQEALRIYLRDLHCAIVVEDAPAALLGHAISRRSLNKVVVSMQPLWPGFPTSMACDSLLCGCHLVMYRAPLSFRAEMWMSWHLRWRLSCVPY